MNGIHDMGGMQGAGAVVPEQDEPVFHEQWERLVFAIETATSCQGFYNSDEFRYAIESLPWRQYLESSYYERWLAAIETLLSEKGVISAEELKARVEQVKEHNGTLATSPAPAEPGQLAGRLAKIVREGASKRRETGHAPRFKPGDAVTARNINPVGHTRLPRYIRGKRGTIQSLHGAFSFPDTNARRQGKNPRPVYTVKFAAREVWGEEAAASDSVCVDLWESYLEPAF